MSMFWVVLPLERRLENTGNASTYLGTVAPSSGVCGVSVDADCRTSTVSGWFPHAMGTTAISMAPAIDPRVNDLRTATNRDIVILLHEPTKSVSALSRWLTGRHANNVRGRIDYMVDLLRPANASRYLDSGLRRSPRTSRYFSRDLPDFDGLAAL